MPKGPGVQPDSARPTESLRVARSTMAPMSAKDDAISDLPYLYPGLTRPDLERVVTLLAQAPAADRGLSIAVALKPLLPRVAERLTSLSAAEVTDYLRVTRSAATMTLQQWPDGAEAGPNPDEIYSAVQEIENDS